MFDFPWENHSLKKVAQIVGQDKQTESHLVRVEMFAWQSRPVKGIFSFLDPLFGSSPTIIEIDHALFPGTHIGHYETDL